MVKQYASWLFLGIKVLGDILFIGGGCDLAWWLRYSVGIGNTVESASVVVFDNHHILDLGLIGTLLLVFLASGIYRLPRGQSFLTEA